MAPLSPSHRLPLPQLLGEALSEFLHHTVVLLKSRETLLPCLWDQGEEVYTKLNMWIPRMCCSCGASSDWILKGNTSPRD